VLLVLTNTLGFTQTFEEFEIIQILTKSVSKSIK
jgi:hypothetical protein